MFCLQFPEFKIFSVEDFPYPLLEDPSNGDYQIDGTVYSKVIFESKLDGPLDGLLQKIAIFVSNLISSWSSGAPKWSLAPVGGPDNKYVYVNQQKFEKLRKEVPRKPADSKIVAWDSIELLGSSQLPDRSSENPNIAAVVPSEPLEVSHRDPSEFFAQGSEHGEDSFDSLQKKRERGFIESQWLNVQGTGAPLYLSKKDLPPPLFVLYSFFITKEIIFKNFKTDYSSPPPKGSTKRCKQSENFLTGESVAKLVPIAKVGSDRKHQIERLVQEGYFLEKLRGCRGIALMLARDCGRKNRWGQQKMALYLKRYSKGELFAYVEDGCKLNDVEKNQVAADLIEGLAAMHEKDITHNDIKPENILLGEKGEEMEAVFCDFDLAVEKDVSDFHRVSGSPLWCSPEKMQAAAQQLNYFDFEACKRADIWAFGLILYLFFFKDIPSHLDSTKISNPRSLCNWLVSQYNTSGSFFPEPQEGDSKKHLIWEMLQFKAELRPDMGEIRRRWKMSS